MDNLSQPQKLDDELTRELLAFFKAEIEPRVWGPALERLAKRLEQQLAEAGEAQSELLKDTQAKIGEMLAAVPPQVGADVRGALSKEVQTEGARLENALRGLVGGGATPDAEILRRLDYIASQVYALGGDAPP